MGRVAPGNGVTSRPGSTVATPEYRNPFRSAAVSPERIDQGVDYAGRSGDPIYAIGPAKVVEAISYGGNSGWPDGSGMGTSGGWVSYQLSSGPNMGSIVYIAEGVQPAVSAGDKVDSSTVIGHFAGAGGIETGFAGPVSQGDQTLAYSQGQSDFSSGDIGGWSTQAGVEFSNLLASLGAPAGIPQAGGTHGPGGSLVNIAATQTSASGAGSAAGGGIPTDCLIGLPSLNIPVIPGVYTQTIGTGVCFLSKGNARGVAAIVLMAAGGSMMMVATLVLAAYGVRSAQQPAGRAVEQTGAAVSLIPGAEAAGAATAVAGRNAASGKTFGSAGDAQRRARKAKKGP